MSPIQTRTIVGADGVLNVRLPLPEECANQLATVTIEFTRPQTSTSIGQNSIGQEEWQRIVDQAAGSMANDPMEEPEDLPWPER